MSIIYIKNLLIDLIIIWKNPDENKIRKLKTQKNKIDLMNVNLDKINVKKNIQLKKKTSFKNKIN